MYRLVDIVLKTIEDGSVRPQGVVATTFTVAAANELRERLASKSTKPADTRTRSSLAPA
jgi:ATP-dependent exoDNAse (exonuclease V) beta subunit